MISNPAPPSAPIIAELGYRPIPALIRDHAAARGASLALVQGDTTLTFAELDALMDRISASLQRDGLRPGEAIAICAHATPRYAAVFLGALRAGLAVAPLAPSATPEAFDDMRRDCSARRLFVDAAALDALGGTAPEHAIALDASAPGVAFEDWLLPAGSRPQPVELPPEAPFNIIYSSGTTGAPKGIVQPHGMRWAHVARGAGYGYSDSAVTLLATPLYSNTTLVVFFPTLAFGGCVVLMDKFDAAAYLALAQRHRMTHTMLVPVQYQRIMALPEFDAFDLSWTVAKFCTSAPFDAALKANVVRRWPGALIEFYGMTEGGGTCILLAHEHPDKLHTVGRPAAGSELRLIDADGRELTPEALAAGESGEIVGRSPGMMTGYHGLPEKTREAEWFDAQGTRFIRTGDIGRFDAEGFLTLLDRKKDMIISGGFNIFPSDLEAVLCRHPAVAEAAVVGVPSMRWGETPVAFVVLRATGGVPGDPRTPASAASPATLKALEVADSAEPSDAAALLAWLNARVGKTQRLAALGLVDALPRSAIGKVLKRELRQRIIDPASRARFIDAAAPERFARSAPDAI